VPEFTACIAGGSITKTNSRMLARVNIKFLIFFPQHPVADVDHHIRRSPPNPSNELGALNLTVSRKSRYAIPQKHPKIHR
jgi:hypothetical protein